VQVASKSDAATNLVWRDLDEVWSTMGTQVFYLTARGFLARLSNTGTPIQALELRKQI
jgi:hypothetical protein